MTGAQSLSGLSTADMDSYMEEPIDNGGGSAFGRRLHSQAGASRKQEASDPLIKSKLSDPGSIGDQNSDNAIGLQASNSDVVEAKDTIRSNPIRGRGLVLTTAVALLVGGAIGAGSAWYLSQAIEARLTNQLSAQMAAVQTDLATVQERQFAAAQTEIAALSEQLGQLDQWQSNIMARIAALADDDLDLRADFATLAQQQTRLADSIEIVAATTINGVTFRLALTQLELALWNRPNLVSDRAAAVASLLPATAAGETARTQLDRLVNLEPLPLSALIELLRPATFDTAQPLPQGSIVQSILGLFGVTQPLPMLGGGSNRFSAEERLEAVLIALAAQDLERAIRLAEPLPTTDRVREWRARARQTLDVKQGLEVIAAAVP